MSDTKNVPGTLEVKPVSNTKSVLRARYWIFTWNNYDLEWEGKLVQYFKDAKDYNFQEEKGTEGTPHIQGYVEFITPKRFDTLKKLNEKIHWEPSRSKAAKAYCKKTETRNGKLIEKWKPEITEFRDWQKNIWDIIHKEPDDRKIYWIYDEKGTKGKTKLCKHICRTYKEWLYCAGKASDMKFAISSILQKGELKGCLFDFTRSLENYVSYEGIESIKNGIFFSGKYESGMCLYPTPHVICFANFKPDESALSNDRWVIIDLG